jgi:hypothetical protein
MVFERPVPLQQLPTSLPGFGRRARSPTTWSNPGPPTLLIAGFPIQHATQRLVAQAATETPGRPLARHANQHIATRPPARPNRRIFGNLFNQLTLARLRSSRLSGNWRWWNGLGNRLGRWRRRLGQQRQRNQASIPSALRLPALPAPLRGTPLPGRPPCLPLLRLLAASITAIMTTRMGWPKSPLTPFEQTTSRTKTARRLGRLLCGVMKIEILMRAQGSSCSRRSSLGGELLAPSETLL